MYRRPLLYHIGNVLKRWWIFMMLFITTLSSIEDTSWINSYTKINWGIMAIQIISFPFIFWLTYRVYRLFPKLMGFGLVRIISKLMGKRQHHYSNDEMEGTNINFLGTDIKYLGIVICLVIMTGLPRWSMQEEIWFRQDTANWMDAILRSLVFGFAHMLAGVPIIGALAISGFGLLFSHFYFVGGVELSSQIHFQHNLVIVSLMLFAVTIDSFVKE